MKAIKVKSTTKIEVFDEPTEAVTPDLLAQIYAPIDESKLKIFESFASTEHIIVEIIAYYFYGINSNENKEFKSRFNSLILASDWCSFSSKRKLMMHIINDKNLLDGKEKENYDKLLRNIMSYRNAFAHGEMSTDGRIVKLRYYESTPRKITIDQNYLDKIENDLNDCFEKTFELAQRIGAYYNYKKE